MTKNPVYCLPTDTVFHAAQLMRDEGIGPVPVVEDRESKKVVGIVTDRDLATKVLAAHLDSNLSLDAVMSKTPLVCHTTDNLQAVLDLMSDHQVRRVPIVDNHEKLVGIISQADVATRIGVAKKTAELLEEISKPNQFPTA